jgi:hypothetical protein
VAEDMPEPGLPVGLLRPFPEQVESLVLDGTVRQPGQGEGLPQPRPVMAGPGRKIARAGAASHAEPNLPERGVKGK